MGELTAVEFEQLLVSETEARQRLFSVLSKQPELLKLWCDWVRAQAAITDAARGGGEREAPGA